METLSMSLALCKGNSLLTDGVQTQKRGTRSITGGFPWKGPVTRKCFHFITSYYDVTRVWRRPISATRLFVMTSPCLRWKIKSFTKRGYFASKIFMKISGYKDCNIFCARLSWHDAQRDQLMPDEMNPLCRYVFLGHNFITIWSSSPGCVHIVNTWFPGRNESHFKSLTFVGMLWTDSMGIYLRLLSGECHWTPLMIRQHWFG